jgi:hypothetical protein
MAYLGPSLTLVGGSCTGQPIAEAQVFVPGMSPKDAYVQQGSEVALWGNDWKMRTLTSSVD